MHRTRILNRGQAEVIGATISIGVLLLVIGTLAAQLISTGTQTTMDFAQRTSFENERMSEKLDVVLENGICYLKNTGAIPIKIVRYWKDGNPYTYTQNLPPGGEIAIDADYIVTSRGNIIPFNSICQELQLENQGASGAISGATFTKDQILTGDQYLQPDKSNKLLCSINNNWNNCFVGYKFGSQWYISTPNGWQGISFSGDSDMDDNGINELVLLNILSNKNTNSYVEYRFDSYDSASVELKLVKAIEIDSNTDVVMVTYIVVINASQGSSSPHDFQLPIDVALESGNTKAVFPSSYASVNTLKGGFTIFVIQGSAIIPRNAYQTLSTALKPGVYNVSILVSFNRQTNSAPKVYNIRFEIIAVSGAKIAWGR